MVDYIIYYIILAVMSYILVSACLVEIEFYHKTVPYFTGWPRDSIRSINIVLLTLNRSHHCEIHIHVCPVCRMDIDNTVLEFSIDQVVAYLQN